MRKLLLTLLLAGCAAPGMAATIATTPDGNYIYPFGHGGSSTYGEVFTAPVTGVLTSFTLSLNGGVGALYGAVGTWNGTAAFDLGFGSPTTLYQSANVASSGAQDFTFAPGVAVTAGQRYVAYLSTYAVEGVTAFTSMPTASGAPGANYFVFNNDSDPRNNASWDYFASYDGSFGDVAFTATFAPTAAVPEPATWATMIGGTGAAGAMMRRRRRTNGSAALA